MSLAYTGHFEFALCIYIGCVCTSTKLCVAMREERDGKFVHAMVPKCLTCTVNDNLLL